MLYIRQGQSQLEIAKTVPVPTATATPVKIPPTQIQFTSQDWEEMLIHLLRPSSAYYKNVSGSVAQKDDSGGHNLPILLQCHTPRFLDEYGKWDCDSEGQCIEFLQPSAHHRQ